MGQVFWSDWTRARFVGCLALLFLLMMGVVVVLLLSLLLAMLLLLSPFAQCVKLTPPALVDPANIMSP
jgi:hypothetical protein